VVKKLLPEEGKKEEKKYQFNLISKMTKFTSLNQSKQFLRILKEKRLNTKYFTIYFEKNLDNTKKNDNKNLNISFVVKKNVGNAVTRNKIKRKLKAAVQKILKEKQLIDLNYTYVIFGRNKVYKDKFPLVFCEVDDIFKRIKRMVN
tara:strand:- start:31 stop:468 length:438 start_codon:yes stop_codon:yes gene_type:complete